MIALALTVSKSTGRVQDAACPFDHDELDHTLWIEGDVFECQHNEAHVFDRVTLEQVT